MKSCSALQIEAFLSSFASNGGQAGLHLSQHCIPDQIFGNLKFTTYISAQSYSNVVLEACSATVKVLKDKKYSESAYGLQVFFSLSSSFHSLKFKLYNGYILYKTIFLFQCCDIFI